MKPGSRYPIISEHGFNNGVDCAAMPAIAAMGSLYNNWRYPALYEMLPGIIKYAEEADARYDEEMQLVHATMCLAQDALKNRRMADTVLEQKLHLP